VVLGCNSYDVIDLGCDGAGGQIRTPPWPEAPTDRLSGLITPSLDEMVSVAAEMQRVG